LKKVVLLVITALAVVLAAGAAFASDVLARGPTDAISYVAFVDSISANAAASQALTASHIGGKDVYLTTATSANRIRDSNYVAIIGLQESSFQPAVMPNGFVNEKDNAMYDYRAA
jgi:hypothetical protein